MVIHDHSLMIQAHTQYGNKKSHIISNRNALSVKCLVSMQMK